MLRSVANRLTSAIQRVMERGSIIALQTTVSELRAGQDAILERLHEELLAELSKLGAKGTPPSAALSSGSADCSLLAVYRGKYVGCLSVERVDPSTYQLRDLFVQSGRRGEGIGKLLIRAALERVSISKGSRVTINFGRVPSGTTESGRLIGFFEVNGFQPAENKTLSYALTAHDPAPKAGAAAKRLHE